MRLVGIGAEPVVVELSGVAHARVGVVLHAGELPKGVEANGRFDGEVGLVGQGSCTVVGGDLRGDVETVLNEVICIALEERDVFRGPRFVAGCEGVRVGEDEKVACFFDRLRLGVLVVVAGGVRITAANIVDDKWLSNYSQLAIDSIRHATLTCFHRPVARYCTTGSSSSLMYSGSMTKKIG